MAKAGEWQQALHLLHQVQVNLGMWELLQSHHLFICTCKFAFIVVQIYSYYNDINLCLGVAYIPLSKRPVRLLSDKSSLQTLAGCPSASFVLYTHIILRKDS